MVASWPQFALKIEKVADRKSVVHESKVSGCLVGMGTALAPTLCTLCSCTLCKRATAGTVACIKQQAVGCIHKQAGMQAVGVMFQVLLRQQM